MNDGGSAFPTFSSDTHFTASGMSLRQWYAGMALSGLVQRRLEQPGDMQVVVQAAFAYADLMLAMDKVVPLKERSK